MNMNKLKSNVAPPDAARDEREATYTPNEAMELEATELWVEKYGECWRSDISGACIKFAVDFAARSTADLESGDLASQEVEKPEFYHVELFYGEQSQGGYVDTLDQIKDTITDWSLGIGDSYKITRVDMTQDEADALPEFEGF